MPSGLPWLSEDFQRPVVQEIKYVTPNKVYVLTKPNMVPYMVVQTKDMASYFTAVDGGESYLVDWYPMARFKQDMDLQQSLMFEEEPSYTRFGETQYIPRRGNPTFR